MASRALWQRLLKPDAHADDGALPKKSTAASWPRRLGFVVLWLALVPGAYFLAAVIISAVTPPLNQLLVALSLTLPVRQSTIMALVFLLTLAIVWAVATFCFRTPVSLRTFGLQRTMRWRDIGLGIAAYIIYMAVALFLVDLAGRFVPGFQANQAQDLGFRDVYHTADIIVLFLLLVLVTPLVEEMLFRGVLFGKLQKYLPVGVSAVLVSAVFAALHGPWNVALDVFVLSLVLCWLRLRTHNIWAGVVVHVIKNSLAFYLMYVVQHGGG